MSLPPVCGLTDCSCDASAMPPRAATVEHTTKPDRRTIVTLMPAAPGRFGVAAYGVDDGPSVRVNKDRQDDHDDEDERHGVGHAPQRLATAEGPVLFRSSVPTPQMMARTSVLSSTRL